MISARARAALVAVLCAALTSGCAAGLVVGAVGTTAKVGVGAVKMTAKAGGAAVRAVTPGGEDETEAQPQ
ncbi:MAG: hypothetical protein AB7L41_01505 [Flavobacteriaceae bacterium]